MLEALPREHDIVAPVGGDVALGITGDDDGEAVGLEADSRVEEFAPYPLLAGVKLALGSEEVISLLIALFVAKELGIGPQHLQVIGVLGDQLSDMGGVLACGVALTALRLLGQQEPERDLLVGTDLLIWGETDQLGLSSGIVLLQDVLVDTQGGGIPRGDTASTHVRGELLLRLLRPSRLEEVEDPVIVRTAVFGIESSPSAVFTPHRHGVLGEGEELDLHLRQLPIGLGHRAEALL